MVLIIVGYLWQTSEVLDLHVDVLDPAVHFFGGVSLQTTIDTSIVFLYLMVQPGTFGNYKEETATP